MAQVRIAFIKGCTLFGGDVRTPGQVVVTSDAEASIMVGQGLAVYYSDYRPELCEVVEPESEPVAAEQPAVKGKKKGA